MHKVLIALVFVYASHSALAHAAQAPVRTREARSHLFDLPTEPTRKRAFVGPPLLSFLLPGFDQWYEEQYHAAGIYTGTALAGLGIGLLGLQGVVSSSPKNEKDENLRTLQLGLQLEMAAGSFSAYHSFRSAVRSQQANGEFLFLTHEESVADLLAAPFQFHELTRPTTYVPLAIVLAGSTYALSQDTHAAQSYKGSDVPFALAPSYLAGTHEEALFRGWLMPVQMHYFNNRFWSNTSTALLFAAAHISPANPVPWPQFALGWYLGYLTQRNQWTLSQGIFIHAWWDAIVFTAQYLSIVQHPDRENQSAYLPPVTFSF